MKYFLNKLISLHEIGTHENPLGFGGYSRMRHVTIPQSIHPLDYGTGRDTEIWGYTPGWRVGTCENPMDNPARPSMGLWDGMSG